MRIKKADLTNSEGGTSRPMSDNQRCAPLISGPYGCGHDQHHADDQGPKQAADQPALRKEIVT